MAIPDEFYLSMGCGSFVWHPSQNDEKLILYLSFYDFNWYVMQNIDDYPGMLDCNTTPRVWWGGEHIGKPIDRIIKVTEGYTFKDKTTKREISQSDLLQLFKHSNSTEINESTEKINKITQLKQCEEVSMEVTLPELEQYPYIVGFFGSKRTLPAQEIKLNIKFTMKSIESKEIEVDYEVSGPDKIETVAIYDTAFFQTKRYYVIKIQNKKFVLTNSWIGFDGYTYEFDLCNILSGDIQKFRQLAYSTINIYSKDLQNIVEFKIIPKDLRETYNKSEKLHTAIIPAHDYNYLQISEAQPTQPTTPQA